MAKVSKKLRNKCLDAVSFVCLEIQNETNPEWIDGTPETWSPEVKEKFDFIGEIEQRICAKLAMLLSV